MEINFHTVYVYVKLARKVLLVNYVNNILILHHFAYWGFIRVSIGI